jgi:type II secretory pathway component GspD/PulD (secretin)
VRQVGGADVVAVVTGDRVVVSGPERAYASIDQVASRLATGVDGWMLQVRFVSVSEAVRRAAGLDWSVSGRANVGVDAATGFEVGEFPTLGARVAASVGVVFSAAESERGAKVLREGRVYVLEGAEAEFGQGESVPVPRRTVSDQGTVTVTGFDRIETGFRLKVAAKRVDGGVSLDLKPSVSAITGYVEGYPITSESSVSSTVVLASGEYCILMGLDLEDESAERRGVPGVSAVLGSFHANEHSRTSILVVVRAVRVKS